MARLAIHGGTPIRTRPFAKWPVFDEREKRALNEVLESGSWGGYNPKVREFEHAFAAYHEAAHAVAASNGTVTLEGALLAAGVGPGDEVIVPPITFIATATAVLRVGATPVFADIESHYNLDPLRVQEAITPLTTAMIPVHFAGHPADMDALTDVARKHRITIIEDAAHAHGASWKSRRVGTFGDIASFSFQQSKNMTAGEGGILIGNNAELIEAARSVFNQGRVAGGGWYDHARLGTNQRLTAWQAAVLLVQLQRLPEQLAIRAENARYLDEQLARMEFLQVTPADARVTCHGNYLYMIRVRSEKLSGVQAKSFTEALTSEGIPGVGRYPRPIYQAEVFQHYPHRADDCPQALLACRDAFWISHEILLSPREDVDDFLAAMTKIAENSGELQPVSV
ncbi:MAG TPA: DegT/DnrJ/EryC1/StrS family aminotransferase [Bryobacteraceae bacterium]|jgi:dTDP-4-amino-4,6-dideoxygalactose transaminase